MLKGRRTWKDTLQAQEKSYQPRLLYPTKLSFVTEGARKIFHDKQKLKRLIY
jgi:hypothetical protein